MGADLSCSCPANYYDSGVDCFQCADGQYYPAADATSCNDCENNCEQCEDFSGYCITCADTFELDANGNCVCPDGYYDDGTGCVVVPTCDEGTYFNGIDCVTCGTNCAFCEAWTGVCVECTTNDHVLGDTDCSCPTTMYDNGQTCDEFVQCPDGEYTNYDQNICDVCGEGCATCTSATECTSCTDPDHVP